MSKENNEIYGFGPFVLNIAERRLDRNGKTPRMPNRPLTDKAFQTLCILVRNPGHLIAKQELLDLVWPDSFVEENNLDKCIHAIRQALHEAPRQKYIETVPKHGYRFVADVRRISADEDSVQTGAGGRAANLHPVIESAETRPAPTTNKNLKILASILGIAVLAAAAGLSIFLYRTPPASGAVTSIAVLPVKPINSATRDELYEIGTTDSLINRLSLMKGLLVRPLSAVRKYTDIGQDPLAAGREQKVDYVLDSNYQLADGKFRITSRLINVTTGEIEETYKDEVDASKVFAVQDAVASEFGNRLLARFGGKWTGQLAKRGTDNEEAYRLYLQGIYFYDKRDLGKLRNAVESLEQAVRLDPNYALAWAGKAHVHRAVTIYERRVNIHEENEKSVEAMNNALALDPNLSEAHSALCETKFGFEWDFAGAEPACKRAIELNPASSLAHQVYARFLWGRGRFDEAISEIKTAIDLEPASFYNQYLYGICLQHARRYDEAIVQLKRAMAMDESVHGPHGFLSMTLAFLGKESDAFDVWIKSPDVQNADELTVRAFQVAFRTSGWQGVMRERVKRFEDGERLYYLGAVWCAQAGEKDKAFQYLERSYERREWFMTWLLVDPRLDPLRDDPRLDELIRRVG
jgi:DNA-binding winged helix-turn-helix (wHTH) protein/TolB-like protein/Tfp pilus assembly protein PilF